MILLKKNGFTLVELLISLAIMGIVFPLIYGIMTNGLKMNSTVNVRNNVQSDIRQTMVMISDDIRKGVQFIDDFSATEVKPIDSDTDLLALIQAMPGNNPNTYTPIIYIKQLDNKLLLYAAKNVSTNIYELHKINLKYSNTSIQYNYDNNNNVLTNPSDYYGNTDFTKIKMSAIDVDQVKYLSDNYQIKNVSNLSLDTFTFPNNNYPQSLTDILTTTPCSILQYGFNDTPTTNSITVNLPVNFYYYQGQDIFRCVYYTDPIDPSKNGFRSIKLIQKPRPIEFVNDTLISGNLSNIPTIISQNDGKSYNITVMASSTNHNSDYHKTLSSNVAIENYGGDNDDK